ncbi:MAG: hypothetical protein ACYC35_02710 [Pirellulales bacterium]|jgi:hypothetical protein
MLLPGIVQEVQRLLAEGRLSQRKIALAAGVARATVGAIASGARPDYTCPEPVDDDEFPEILGPLGRCPSCGGLVYMPCRLCRVRAWKEGRSKG